MQVLISLLLDKPLTVTSMACMFCVTGDESGNKEGNERKRKHRSSHRAFTPKVFFSLCVHVLLLLWTDSSF